MHEWALAEAVIASALEESRKGGLGEVTEITLRIGELQHLELEIFKFALDELAKSYAGSPSLQSLKIKIEPEQAIFKCRVCGAEWDFGDPGLDQKEYEAVHFAPEVAHAYIRCPSCKSPDFEVIQGRGVLIHSIKGKQ
ncbi:MAG: hydrogenase nickel incorporation protein HypA [Methanophagales archaeon ANME-1-THS]|nr:MAG: hydrogenase nickel incorporation protein HypA [Methanophagales archaeon ANME-1-THS]